MITALYVLIAWSVIGSLAALLLGRAIALAMGDGAGEGQPAELRIREGSAHR